MSAASAASGTAIRLFNLGLVSGIPEGEGRTFQAGGHDIAVFRGRGGAIHATSAWCPHQGGPLADGLIGRDQVICPMHGLRFDLRSGLPQGHQCERLQVYPVTVTAHGEIVVTVHV